MKLTRYGYACNNLTNFDYKVQAKNRKRKPSAFAKTCFVKIREITLRVSLFLAGFSYLEPLCGIQQAGPGLAPLVYFWPIFQALR